jgi:ribosomal protein S6--L-glutamate ligase
MRFAVLASPDSWYLKDLQRAAADRHEVVGISFRQLTAGVISQQDRFTCAGIDLKDVDAVLVRTMPPASLEQVVFRMDVLGQLERTGVRVINPARALEAAVDKYLATAKLAAAGLLTPRTVVCQTVDDAMETFTQLGGDVVLKPLFGGEGRGIARLNDEAVAQRTFSLLANLNAVLYLQEFVPHAGYDYRVLLVGQKAFGMRRLNPLDWRTNISRGAIAEPLELTDELVEQAHRAAIAIGAPVAGVDLLPVADGRLYAIEVNAVPGWRALNRVGGYDIAREVLQFAGKSLPARYLRREADQGHREDFERYLHSIPEIVPSVEGRSE